MNFRLIIAGLIAAPAVCLAAESAADSTRVYDMGEVVVTGSNSATGRNLLPYTVTTVTSEQIEATGKVNVLSAISGQVPGLFVSQRGIYGFDISNGGSGGIKIRGVGGNPTNAVLMMVDGQPQYSGVFSHPVGDMYGTQDVERVEVLRGPGSVLYGSNAMGGVVNVITRHARRDGVHTVLSSQYGSYNTWQSQLTNTTRFGRFSSLVSAAYNRTDGSIKGMRFHDVSAYAKVGYDFSRRWRASLDYSIMQFKGRDPVYPTLSDPQSTDVYRQNVIRGEVSAAVTNSYANTDGSIRTYYSYGNHYIDDPRHFHSLDDRFGVVVYQNFSPWRGNRATAGFDFDSYRGRVPVSGGNAHRPGALPTMDSKNIVEYSPYVTMSQSFMDDLLILNAGIRMANSNKFDTEWVPQGGFVIHPGRAWMIKASVAKGYRNPSFRELYLYRPANPDLEPENMVNYEVTVGKSWGRWLSVDVTGFYAKGSDMIQTVDMKNVNTGSFINKGIEVSAQSRPLDVLTLQATYSYLHTSLADLTGAPRNQYFLGAQWQALKNLRVDTELRGVGGLFVHQTYRRQNYALWNMRFSWQLIRQLELHLNLDNITDARYTINRGYRMPGFTVMGGFRLSI